MVTLVRFRGSYIPTFFIITRRQTQNINTSKLRITYQVLIPKYYMSFFFSHTPMRDSEFGGDVHSTVLNAAVLVCTESGESFSLEFQSRRFAKNSVPCRINIGSCTLNTLSWVYHRYDSHNPERQNAHNKSRTPLRTLQHPFPSLVAYGDCDFVFVALRNTNVDQKKEKISAGLAKWGSVVSGGLRSPIYSEVDVDIQRVEKCRDGAGD